MNTHPEHNANLPVRHNLTLAYLGSGLVALLMAIASGVGLVNQAGVYPGLALSTFVPNDVLNLILGLPLLLGSMWLARRGQLIGLLCWPGALYYVLYVYAVYLVGAPFTGLFLVYLVLVALSAYLVIGLVASLEGEAVRGQLAGRVPARTSGGILVAIAFLFIARQIAVIVAALTGHTPATALDVAQWIDDLAVLGPAMVMGGVLLWRREALGYAAGAGLLLLGGMLFVGVIPIMIAQALMKAAPVDGAGIVLMLVTSLVCFVPFAFFVRAARRLEPASTSPLPNLSPN